MLDTNELKSTADLFVTKGREILKNTHTQKGEHGRGNERIKMRELSEETGHRAFRNKKGENWKTIVKETKWCRG